MSPLVAIVLGALFGLGVVTAAAGFSGIVPPVRRRSGGTARADHSLRVAASAVLCAVVYAWTGWLIAALFAAVGAAAAPGALARRQQRRHMVAKTEAIAAWTEMLRDTLAAAAGIQEAIIATTHVAPLPIRPEVRRLSDRLQRQPLNEALHDFADRVADPVGDLVIAALLVAAEGQAGSLSSVLSAAASSARATATMRLRVETGRTRTWTSVRVTVAVFGIVTVGLLAFNRAYLRPFDTGGGQVVLAAIGALFIGSFWSLGKMATQREPERVLHARELVA
jgi:Flp pilus assembly protein TadB